MKYRYTDDPFHFSGVLTLFNIKESLTIVRVAPRRNDLYQERIYISKKTAASHNLAKANHLAVPSISLEMGL